MEIKAVVRRYETRNKTAGTELSSKSRVDWRRTKRELIVLDSDDESSCTSEEGDPTASEDEVEEEDETVENSLSDQVEKSHDGEGTEDGDEECIVPGKRKRLNTSVLYDSDDESEDSDIVVRKVFAKRHCIMDEDESSEEQQPDKTCPTGSVSTNRKQKVFAKLKELAKQRATRRSCSSENCEDSNGESDTEEEPLCHFPVTPTEVSETDSDSMKDFIVEDDDDDDKDEDDTEHIKSKNQSQQKKLNISNSELLAYYIPNLSRCDHYVHFKRIVKAFLINAIDDTFLSSLYAAVSTSRLVLAEEIILAFVLVGLNDNLTCHFRSTVKTGLVRGLSVSGCGRSQQSAKERKFWSCQELRGNGESEVHHRVWNKGFVFLELKMSFIYHC